MRVRSIATVVVLSAGCTRAPASDQTTTPVATAAAAPRSVTAIPAPVVAPAAAAPRAEPVDLEQLADELRATSRAQVAAAGAHFRPLCDAAGYPLVGNLITKEAPQTRAQRYDVSDHCATIRGGR